MEGGGETAFWCLYLTGMISLWIYFLEAFAKGCFWDTLVGLPRLFCILIHTLGELYSYESLFGCIVFTESSCKS